MFVHHKLLNKLLGKEINVNFESAFYFLRSKRLSLPYIDGSSF